LAAEKIGHVLSGIAIFWLHTLYNMSDLFHERLYSCEFRLPSVPLPKNIEKRFSLLTWDEKSEAQSFIRDLLAVFGVEDAAATGRLRNAPGAMKAVASSTRFFRCGFFLLTSNSASTPPVSRAV
jgi:hypothetical protein